MRKMIAYIILEAATAAEIEKKVEDAMLHGWQPQGGVSFAPYEICSTQDGIGNSQSVSVESGTYTQAMVQIKPHWLRALLGR